MPVKWTPDNDQLLLLKILETHELSVDAKKISAAWPTDKGEIPTARAITERLVKIRQNARASGAGHFGISSSQAKSSSGKSGTPRKTTTPSSTPRKTNITNDQYYEIASPHSAKRQKTNAASAILVDSDDEGYVLTGTDKGTDMAFDMKRGHSSIRASSNRHSFEDPFRTNDGSAVSTVAVNGKAVSERTDPCATSMSRLSVISKTPRTPQGGSTLVKLDSEVDGEGANVDGYEFEDDTYEM